MDIKEKNIYNVDIAWEKLHSRFEQDGLLSSGNNIRSVDFSMLVKIAAVFIVGLSLSYFGYNSIDNNWDLGNQLTETHADNTIKIIELSDGSVIHLNKNSKLFYPEKFDIDKRVVELEGEAFFDIKNNPQKAFIIKAKNKEVKVLGTSFNVNTNFDSKKVEVFVKTGKVKFYEPGNEKKQLILNPGSIGTLDEKIVDKKLIDDPNYLSWKTKYFDFTKGEKLDNVIATINKAYGVNIILKDAKSANKVMKTTYDNHSLNTILETICNTYNLSKEEQAEAIILKAK